MTDPKKPSFPLEYTSAILRDLEKSAPGIRRKVFSGMERLKRLSVSATRTHFGCSWI
jgi:hypothetical protein